MLRQEHPDFERIVSALEGNAYCVTDEASEALGGLCLERVDKKIARLKMDRSSQARHSR